MQRPARVIIHNHVRPRRTRDANERPTHAFGYELDPKTLTPVRQRVDLNKPGDYGADPLGNGKFKMVPSGDVVDFEERNRRLSRGRDAPETSEANRRLLAIERAYERGEISHERYQRLKGEAELEHRSSRDASGELEYYRVIKHQGGIELAEGAKLDAGKWAVYGPGGWQQYPSREAAEREFVALAREYGGGRDSGPDLGPTRTAQRTASITEEDNGKWSWRGLGSTASGHNYPSRSAAIAAARARGFSDYELEMHDSRDAREPLPRELEIGETIKLDGNDYKVVSVNYQGTEAVLEPFNRRLPSRTLREPRALSAK